MSKVFVMDLCGESEQAASSLWHMAAAVVVKYIARGRAARRALAHVGLSLQVGNSIEQELARVVGESVVRHGVWCPCRELDHCRRV